GEAEDERDQDLRRPDVAGPRLQLRGGGIGGVGQGGHGDDGGGPRGGVGGDQGEDRLERIADLRQGGDADGQHEAQRQRAVAADPAVLQDRQPLLAAAAAAQAVGGVGEPVLVQAAGRQ